MRVLSLKSLGCVTAALAAMHLGCNVQPADTPEGSGGSGSGGSSATGGKTSSGGESGSGGSSTSTGGDKGSGGTSETGGSSAGGSNSGGTTSTGGNGGGAGGTVRGTGGGAGRRTGGLNSGGSTATGGRTGGGSGTEVGTGGTAGGAGTTGAGGGQGGGSGSPAWGKEEDPTAYCTVGTLPEASSFTQANNKLPDPFMKMDGSGRIKDKSEWACRREEILQQGFKYIYGDKPIPPKGAVTGTVSTSSISVKVTDGGKSTSFTATVKMNGATQPAPAIITYGGSGAAAPSGVATISFSPTETTGGSGAKSGPFFSVYGSDHPAGYMVSNAWVVSRIIDVLEQNPGIIDPYRLGVTGCSRWGKGAFVAGVLDNRIALTIPVESGIGGTVALRLVEQLDTSGEWPYHAISYVRWLSEVALGPFTNANSASGDNTAKLPVDMHEMMALIAPRGLYIVDNPSTNYAGLDRNSAWVSGNVGKATFEGLGLGDNFAYQGASGSHCQWRSQYTASLNAMVDKFLKGNASTKTGTVATDFSGPDPKKYYDWTVPTLSGEL